MTKRSSHEWLRLVALVLTGVVPVAWAADPPSTTIRPEEAAFFESRVRPVLVESCQKCHGPEKQTSGLRLDSREAILKGGASGPAVVPGKPDESLLVQAARRTHEDFKMPPKSKLPQPAVDALGQWVAMGAPWPSASSAATSFDPAADHWAFRPVRSPAIPTVADRDWARTPVDPFVLARLEAAGLAPSREADRRALIRRITFDLLGLPPTPADIAAFEADTRPDAYERLVDRLLASPEYGERWARHWLDVARYSDTKGYVFQEERRYPFAYTFRDYVIRSLNEDKPYDTFLIEQIAADRMGPGGDPRSLAALGYLTLGRRFLNVREDIIDDRIDVVGRGMLGLTVGCARCHDHKFDPIPSEDYYSLFGVFASSVEPADLPEIPAAVPADLVKDYHAKVAQKQKPLDEFLAAKTTEIRADLSARLGDYLRLATELNFESRSPRAEERAKQANLTSGRLRGVMFRWKTHLDATRGQPDPVMAAWHAFAALPEPEFAKRAPELLAELTKGSDPKRPVNPALARALQAKPPTNLGDVAACYGAVLTEAGKRWEAASKTGAKALPEPEWEALRRFVASATGPLAINDETIPRWLARDERTKYSNLKNAVDAVKASHPGSPPRAMVLVDAPRVTEPRVLLRGNPAGPVEPCLDSSSRWPAVPGHASRSATAAVASTWPAPSPRRTTRSPPACS